MEEDRNAIFVRLLAEHERRLQHYVRVLLPNLNAADDVLQESKISMWQHFDKFELGTNFNAWAHRFVFNRVLAHRKSKKRDQDLYILSDDFYEMLSDRAEKKAQSIDAQIHHLHSCMDKLPEQQRQILKMRYFDESSIEAIAEKIDKSVDATYRSLSRVRIALRECVIKNIALES